MVDIDSDTVDYLADLSRIGCSEEEKQDLLGDLKKILGLVEMLDEVDTEGVEPTCHVLPEVQNVFREDEIKDVLDRKTFLDNSPSHTGGMIRVPPVLKGGE